jgi:hypothetical protein
MRQRWYKDNATTEEYEVLTEKVGLLHLILANTALLLMLLIFVTFVVLYFVKSMSHGTALLVTLFSLDVICVVVLLFLLKMFHTSEHQSKIPPGDLEFEADLQEFIELFGMGSLDDYFYIPELKKRVERYLSQASDESHRNRLHASATKFALCEKKNRYEYQVIQA